MARDQVKLLDASIALALSLVLVFGVFFWPSEAALPTDLKMAELSQILEEQLDLLIKEATGREMLKQKYSQQIFHLEPVHGEDIIEEAIEKLEPMFQKRIRAVEEIAKKAEELAANHEYQEHPQSSQEHFINGKDWEDPNFIVNNSFIITQHQSGHSLVVNINSSAVHLPLQTYEGWMWHRFKPVWYEDFDTINSLIWSGQLDSVFAENLKRDPTLHWQYFASKEGLLRYFPAHRWRTHTNQQDTYDARQRAWFTQTIASPKDLLILIDMSGSIHGPTFEMVKITVKRLLGTLSQHDYFNVLQFNETVSWLLPCSDMLIPATTRNKRLIYQALDNVEPQGKASFANVLNFTYRLILELEKLRTNDSDSSPRSSNCHLAVVLLSDGGTEFPAEQLEMITNNSITRQTRLFTLAVGPHPIPTLNLRNISCSTNAFHGAILTYGAIRSKVQGYLQVLSRPLALSLDDSLIQWTLPYQDAAGTGEVVSVTKPVFQKGENLSQTLVGVAGVDIPLVSFDRALPDSILGYGGYKMVVVPTGNVVLHPRLDEHSSFIEDQLMVDFEDLEPNGNWTEALRLQLVDGQIGSLEYMPTLMTSDNAYVVRPKRNWHFRPLTKTAYTLAVSTNEGINMIVPNLELQGDIQWNHQVLTRAATRKYCYNINAEFSGYEEMPAYFRQLSESFEKRSGDCDYTALSHLLWDFETTANVSQYWANNSHANSRYVITTGGITRMELGTPEFIQEDLTDPHNSSIFLRLAHSSNASILIQPPSSRRKDYMIAAKIDLKDQLMAVTGALVSTEKILSIWDNILKSHNISDHIFLYWVDEGGYIIASNTDAKLGSFIGNVDPQLADQLLTAPNPVFSKEKVVVSTTSCPVFSKSSPTSSAPAFCARWASNAIHTLFGAAKIFASVLMTTFSFFQTPVSGNFPAEMELEKLRPAPVDSHICSKDYVLFYLKATAESVLELPCNSLCPESNETIRTISVRPLKTSKSVIIAATSPCRCGNTAIKHGLVNVENEIRKCQFNKRFRKSAEICYASDPRENSLKCSAPSVRHRQFFLPSLLFSFMILSVIR